MKTAVIMYTLFAGIGIYSTWVNGCKFVKWSVAKYLEHRIKKAKLVTLKELADKDAEVNDLTMHEWIQKTQRLIDAIGNIVELRGKNVGDWTTPDIILVAKYIRGEEDTNEGTTV